MASKRPDLHADVSADLDVRGALAGIVPPTGAVEISAGFFHRTLARWLGLPAGKQPGRKKSAPPLWDYDFWKAELVDDGADDGSHRFTARIFRRADGPPEVVRYWVKLDGGGRIRSSGWLTAAPILVDEGPRQFQAPPPPSKKALAALYSDRE